MRRLAALLTAFLALVATPLAAQAIVEETVVWVDENGNEVPAPEDAPANWRWVDVEPATVPQGIAGFGPFRVMDNARAAMVGLSDAQSPAAFAAMLRTHPGIRTIEMLDVPGTLDDRANLRLGRMIRAAGIATHVPRGGSVRSGGVEVFLAGTSHTADEGAEFAVHSWQDEDGFSPRDYGPDAPENRAYILYYQEMGMTADQARAFYAMTNSVPFEEALWMSKTEMARWARLD